MIRNVAFAAALGFCFAPTLARADAIDGNWCRGDKRFEIDGPAIVTPAGAHTQGDYMRHYFSFIVPPGEDGAGKQEDMVLHNETTVEVRPPGGAPEIWKRCGAPTS
jgi:hypothetical protein